MRQRPSHQLEYELQAAIARRARRAQAETVRDNERRRRRAGGDLPPKQGWREKREHRYHVARVSTPDSRRSTSAALSTYTIILIVMVLSLYFCINFLLSLLNCN